MDHTENKMTPPVGFLSIKEPTLAGRMRSLLLFESDHCVKSAEKWDATPRNISFYISSGEEIRRYVDEVRMLSMWRGLEALCVGGQG